MTNGYILIDKKMSLDRLSDILSNLLFEHELVENFIKKANITPEGIFQDGEDDKEVWTEVNILTLAEKIAEVYEGKEEELCHTIISLYNDYE